MSKMGWDRKQCLSANAVACILLFVAVNMLLYSSYVRMYVDAKGIFWCFICVYIIYKLNIHTATYTYCTYVTVCTYTYVSHTVLSYSEELQYFV